MTDLCSIKICGSSTWCEICGLAWDTNDDEPGCAIIPNSPAELAVRNALALGEKRGRMAMQREIVAMLRDLARTDKEGGHKPEAVALFEAAYQAERMP